ncbi:VOC family protein [Nocardioides convexus]|uniref:VOC family protein n=1 Tax=Nocardioides convexus TaxID=2712224 RepID=UPI0024187A12|nr:VOC family protein [Nocardioides convexus]
MAAVDFVGIRLDAYDVSRISAFWAQLLGWTVVDRVDGSAAVVPGSASGYPLSIWPSTTPKSAQNRIHFDLTTGSSEEMRHLITRTHALGGADVDVGQSPDEPHTVLADPEGNEFCVIPPENTFLADAGPVGAINCDGSQAVGYFWSEALGWPLVWDQDEETAIQSPAGGSKITWSGPPLMPRQARDRLRFESLHRSSVVSRDRPAGVSRRSPWQQARLRRPSCSIPTTTSSMSWDVSKGSDSTGTSALISPPHKRCNAVGRELLRPTQTPDSWSPITNIMSDSRVERRASLRRRPTPYPARTSRPCRCSAADG